MAGSFLFWVQGDSCKTSSCAANAKQSPPFAPTKSTTFSSAPSAPQYIAYGDGSGVNCTISQDVVAVGNLRLPSQQVCVASAVNLVSGTLDGIMGLGPPGNSMAGQADVFGSLVQRDLGPAQAGFWFNLTNAYPYGAGTGEVSLGGLDSSKYSGSMLTIPLGHDKQRWSLSLDFITKSDGSVLYSSRDQSVMVDSGTTLIYLPAAAVTAINSQFGAQDVGKNGTWLLPCAQVPSTTLSFFLGGSSTSFTLSVQSLFIPLYVGSSQCYSVIQPSDKVGNLIILGALFMQNYYIVYDYSAASLGFASTVQPASSTKPIGQFGVVARPKENTSVLIFAIAGG
ncbi:Vacuolar protease A, partial [Kappamyces sp. JEL0680]